MDSGQDEKPDSEYLPQTPTEINGLETKYPIVILADGSVDMANLVVDMNLKFSKILSVTTVTENAYLTTSPQKQKDLVKIVYKIYF